MLELTQPYRKNQNQNEYLQTKLPKEENQAVVGCL